MANKNKAISEVLAMLLMIVIVVGLIGVVYFFISGMVARQTAGVLQVGGAYCNIANSRLEVLLTNVGTTTIPASDIRIFIGGSLINSRTINAEDKSTPLTNIDPGVSFWVLINDVDG
ncbi:MAG: type IV pilin, partial [Candidatus Aenigmatarchaeota archaeon]